MVKKTAVIVILVLMIIGIKVIPVINDKKGLVEYKLSDSSIKNFLREYR
jgi:hypothetical protein